MRGAARTRARRLPGGLVLAGLACAARPAPPDARTAGHDRPTDGAPPQDGPRRGAAADAPASDELSEPILVLTDPAAMARLESRGLAIGSLVFGGGDAQIRSFRDDPGYASIRATLQRDLRERLAADENAGVGMRHRHRAFDIGWLSDDRTRFELVAVVNRIDRRPFDTTPGRCGEVRLVYRLAYATRLEGEAVDSRLPMTVNVVYWQPGDDCAEVAQRWLGPAHEPHAAIADRLLAQALAPERLVAANLKSVEVNLQTVRWPSVMHPSLGGHAEYVLRVFERTDATGAFRAASLENTPDVRRIAKSDSLRKELRDWIAASLQGLEQGTAVMPDALTTTQAISVAPRGLARLANRPFSQLVSASDLEALDLSRFRHIGSPQALLRRLDELSCQGCHETRSVAGFHVVGEARDPADRLDAVAVPTSAHLHGDLERRRAYALALAQGRPVDESRPLASFDSTSGYGAHCGLGDPGLAAFTCADGFRCEALDDPLMGTCLPDTTKSAGDPCELGILRTHVVGHKDRVRDAEIGACAASAVCNVNKVGFPNGMCTARCDALAAGEACGPIVNLDAFNTCVGRGRPFPRCIAAAAHPVGLRGCDESSRCRDDYVCARSPHDDRGVCLPPYFLFQLRVDGHVL